MPYHRQRESLSLFAAIPEVYLLIDQISIDKSKIDERSSQVQFMSDIYKSSDSVITWLGDGSSTESTRMCYEAAKQFNETKEVMPLAKILQREYFNRLWIIQEVLFAKSVRVLIHNVWIPWIEMNLKAQPKEDCQEALAAGTTSPVWFLICISGGARTHSLRLPYVDKYSTFDCADPRDKFYGLFFFLHRTAFKAHHS
jgi:hypothetical protein